jgi:hypothetical protein
VQGIGVAGGVGQQHVAASDRVEHDFGAFDEEGQNYFRKIDYYDPSLSYHSDDASDPEKTVRVLTLMRAEEC